MKSRTSRRQPSRRVLHVALAVAQLFVGLNGVIGGIMLCLDPSGAAMGFSVDLLDGTPFSDFLIPGLTLLLVIGAGSLAGAWLSWRRHRLTGEAAITLGLAMALFIVFETVWLGPIIWLQLLFFGLGLVEVAFGRALCRLREAR